MDVVSHGSQARWPVKNTKEKNYIENLAVAQLLLRACAVWVSA